MFGFNKDEAKKDSKFKDSMDEVVRIIECKQIERRIWTPLLTAVGRKEFLKGDKNVLRANL